jgi:membrane protease YdiL (CAAX protease family)
MNDEPPLPLEEQTPPPPPPPPEREPFWNYYDLVVFAGTAIPCILLGFGVVKLFFWLIGFKPANDAILLLPAQAMGYLLLFCVLFLIFRVYGRPFWRSLGWVTPGIPPFQVVGAGLGAAISVVVVGSLIQTPNAENEITKLMKDPISLGMMIVFGVTIAPLCEELAFRGFLQPLLVRSFGAIPGIVGAAIPFGLLHFREYGNSWRHALLISLAGAAFGWMRQATGSTLASTLMHSAYNALFFAAFLASRGYVR